ncbi:MAG: T9SS type A sorting domain-containing protein [Bacteroidota bacterium]
MKKLLLLSILSASFSLVQAQNSTLTKLVDSLPAGGFDIIETYKNKLYTMPQHVGGNIYQVDTASGTLTHQATLPMLPTGWEYTTRSGNFIFLKNKTIAAAMNTSGSGTFYIAAGLGTVDTLLKNYNSFGAIRSIDTMAYILATKSLPAQYLFSTNLATPIQAIDSNIIRMMPAYNQKSMYYVRNTTTTDQSPLFKRTNGITHQLLESTPNVAHVISMIGEINGDMYYSVSSRATALDTTWIKKCDASGVISVIDTILMKAYVEENGLVMGNKLILPFKRETSPYYQDLIVYDLNTLSKVNISQNSYYIRIINLQQTQVATNHFYYNSISPIKTYISDGTVAGTHTYTNSLGSNIELEFENYDYYQSLGNKAILCDEYPVAGLTNEFHYGNSMNMTKFTLFPGLSSYPSHFVKIASTLFFRTRNAGYTKMSIIKQSGCGSPVGIPQSLINHDNDIDFAVYPIPATSFLQIELSKVHEAGTQIKINNLLGQTIYQSTANETNLTINCSEFKSGIYFVTVESKTSKAVKKIIVQ